MYLVCSAAMIYWYSIYWDIHVVSNDTIRCDITFSYIDIYMYYCKNKMASSLKYPTTCTWWLEMKRKKERKTGTWGKMKKWKMSWFRLDLNPRHSAFRTDALTNWATKAAQLARSKSNISSACVNRLTETWYVHVHVHEPGEKVHVYLHVGWFSTSLKVFVVH